MAKRFKKNEKLLTYGNVYGKGKKRISCKFVRYIEKTEHHDCIVFCQGINVKMNSKDLHRDVTSLLSF